MMDSKHAWALITGASAGIGAEFARQLAGRGYDLILVARRRERLEALKDTLTKRYPVKVDVFFADLSSSTGVLSLEDHLAEFENLEVLVNNAGFGFPGFFAETEIEAILTMINVHVLASVRLTRSVLPGMIERGRGYIIQVSSISAFNAATGSPTYGATKAYLNAFTDGLVTELSGTGVHVQALCPGFTHTEFHDSKEYEDLRVKQRLPGIMWMNSDQVVKMSLNKIVRSSGIYVPGLGNKLLSFFGASGLTRIFFRLIQAVVRKGPFSM